MILRRQFARRMNEGAMDSNVVCVSLEQAAVRQCQCSVRTCIGGAVRKLLQHAQRLLEAAASVLATGDPRTSNTGQK